MILHIWNCSRSIGLIASDARNWSIKISNIEAVKASVREKRHCGWAKTAAEPFKSRFTGGAPRVVLGVAQVLIPEDSLIAAINCAFDFENDGRYYQFIVLVSDRDFFFFPPSKRLLALRPLFAIVN